MNATSDVIALVTARGGSKGISRKNLRVLAGKPLVDWTLEVSLDTPEIDETFLSSDDREILERGERLGVTCINRPLALSQDDSSHVDVVMHALDEMRSRHDQSPTAVVVLQPTSPLRSAEDISRAVALFRNEDADSVISVTEVTQHPWLSRTMTADGRLKPFLDVPRGDLRRQSLPRLVRPNGAIYVLNASRFRRSRSFEMASTFAFEMPPERSVDIDTEFDLRIAAALLKQESGS